MYEEWNAESSNPECSLRDYLVTAKALVKETFMIWIYYIVGNGPVGIRSDITA
jgi:hypothetical protein